jgi:hypothetical protein
MIVTLPEETPVTEALELATELQGDIGLGLLPTVVNACWPDRPGLAKTPTAAARSQKVTLSASAKAALASSTDFGRERLTRQRQQIDRLASSIGTPLVCLPRLATPRLTLHQLGELADALVSPASETGAGS